MGLLKRQIYVFTALMAVAVCSTLPSGGVDIDQVVPEMTSVGANGMQLAQESSWQDDEEMSEALDGDKFTKQLSMEASKAARFLQQKQGTPVQPESAQVFTSVGSNAVSMKTNTKFQHQARQWDADMERDDPLAGLAAPVKEGNTQQNHLVETQPSSKPAGKTTTKHVKMDKIHTKVFHSEKGFALKHPDLSWKKAKVVSSKFQGDRVKQKKMLKRVKQKMAKSLPKAMDLKGAYDPKELRAKNNAYGGGGGGGLGGLDWTHQSTRVSYSSASSPSWIRHTLKHLRAMSVHKVVSSLMAMSPAQRSALLAAMSPAERKKTLAAMTPKERAKALAGNVKRSVAALMRMSSKARTAALAAMTPKTLAKTLAAMTPKQRALALAGMTPKQRAAARAALAKHGKPSKKGGKHEEKCTTVPECMTKAAGYAITARQARANAKRCAQQGLSTREAKWRKVAREALAKARAAEARANELRAQLKANSQKVVDGFRFQVTAALSPKAYTQAVDLRLRKAVAKQMSVALSEVLTLSVSAAATTKKTMLLQKGDTKSAPKTAAKKQAGAASLAFMVVGSEQALKKRANKLMQMMRSGAVGGLRFTSVKLVYRKGVTVSIPKAAKAPAPAPSTATSVSKTQELHTKARTREIHAKSALAEMKANEAKLKNQEAELRTKAAAKEALRRERERTQKANAAETKHPFSGGGGKKAAKALREAMPSGATIGGASFRVLIGSFWHHQRVWLKNSYPKLHDALEQAKLAGNAKGDNLWMTFLLNWQYTKRRENLGFRYKWHANGEYSVVRYVVLSCRRYLGKKKKKDWEQEPQSDTAACKGRSSRNVYSVSIRSVNNMCYPGIRHRAIDNLRSGAGVTYATNSREKVCNVLGDASVRLSRFRLVKPKRKKATGLLSGINGAPILYMLRAYRTLRPSHYGATWANFARRELTGAVGVHRIKWSLDMLVEYCGEREQHENSAAHYAAPYDEDKSWPRKMHELGKMAWDPIVISKKQEQYSDLMLTVLVLRTTNKRITVTCRTPSAAGVVNGMPMLPTDTKCDIRIKHWPYSLRCPSNKIPGIALSTSVLTRYDDHVQKPNSADKTVNKVQVNAGKMSLKFQKQATLRLLETSSTGKTEWVGRGKVPVKMLVSKPHWIPSEHFQSHRHYMFSFSMSEGDSRQISSADLLWDPQLSSHFRSKSEESISLISTQMAAAHRISAFSALPLCLVLAALLVPQLIGA